MTRRLDAAVAARGLARSRTHAAALIAEGLVTVNGRPIVKPSTPVTDDAEIQVAASDHYVSRAAHKLIAGLNAFEIEVAGRTALDMGASTGGFTQVLRERGAEPVIAVDVGHGQLSERIAADPGVISIEGFNVRYMTAESLAAASGVQAAPQLVTGDLSFISLAHVLPAVVAVMGAGADAVLLVTDAASRADAVAGVLWAAWDVGLGTRGIVASPLAGTHGNAEYVVHLRSASDDARRGTNPTEWLSTVNRLTGSP